MNRDVVEQGLLVRMEKVVAPLDEVLSAARLASDWPIEELQAPPDEREEPASPSTLTRAASSIASGRPSTRPLISAASQASSSVSWKLRRQAHAR